MVAALRWPLTTWEGISDAENELPLLPGRVTADLGSHRRQLARSAVRVHSLRRTLGEVHRPAQLTLTAGEGRTASDNKPGLTELAEGSGMNAQSRLAKAEQTVKALALGYVERLFGLSEADLFAAQRLKETLRKYPSETFEKFTLSMVDVLADKAGENRRGKYYERITELQAAAGLNHELIQAVAVDVYLDFAPDGPVTVETLIALDRAIYEKARITSEVTE